MSKTQHTPGPWKAFHKDGMFSHVVHDMKHFESTKKWQKQNGFYNNDFSVQPNGDTSTIHTQNSVEDANLIAAAPELLKALIALTKEAHKNMIGGRGDLIDDARAAIIKAKGE